MLSLDSIVTEHRESQVGGAEHRLTHTLAPEPANGGPIGTQRDLPPSIPGGPFPEGPDSPDWSEQSPKGGIYGGQPLFAAFRATGVAAGRGWGGQGLTIKVRPRVSGGGTGVMAEVSRVIQASYRTRNQPGEFWERSELKPIAGEGTPPSAVKASGDSGVLGELRSENSEH